MQLAKSSCGPEIDVEAIGVLCTDLRCTYILGLGRVDTTTWHVLSVICNFTHILLRTGTQPLVQPLHDQEGTCVMDPDVELADLDVIN